MPYKVLDVEQATLESETGTFASLVGSGQNPVVRDSFVLLRPGDDGAESLTMGYTVVYPGCRTRGHEHADREEAYYVVRGRGTAVLDKEEVEVREGMAFHIPFGKFHAMINPSKTCLEYVWVIVPKR